MGYLIGIDEAGVGPVLGPLVVGGVRIERKDLGLLEDFGVKDSKLFGSGKRAIERRKAVWQKIERVANFWVEKIAVEELDCQNWILLEIRAIGRILERLRWREAERIFVGWLGRLRREKFLEFLGRRMGVKKGWLEKKIVYEKDAERELVVAAASILAKVERDREVKRLCESVGFGYVSGYCNNKTAEFLKKCQEKYGRLPSFVRKSRKWKVLWELGLGIENHESRIMNYELRI